MKCDNGSFFSTSCRPSRMSTAGRWRRTSCPSCLSVAAHARLTRTFARTSSSALIASDTHSTDAQSAVTLRTICHSTLDLPTPGGPARTTKLGRTRPKSDSHPDAVSRVPPPSCRSSPGIPVDIRGTYASSPFTVDMIRHLLRLSLPNCHSPSASGTRHGSSFLSLARSRSKTNRARSPNFIGNSA